MMKFSIAAFAAAAALFAAAAPASAEDIPFGFSMTVGPDGPSFSMSVGETPEPTLAAKACFFKSSNYGGPSFCVPAGASKAELPGSWDDNISSLKLIGGAEVTVCRQAWFNNCTTYHNSKPTLTASWNNKISSFEVY